MITNQGRAPIPIDELIGGKSGNWQLARAVRLNGARIPTLFDLAVTSLSRCIPA